MFLVPGPAPEERKSFIKRALQFLGLGSLAVTLFVVAAGAFIATEFFAATPQKLYLRVWQAAPIFMYDPSELKDWDQWKGKFDDRIKTEEDAVKYANEMLDSIKDPFTHYHSREEVAAMQQEMSGTFAGIGIGLSYKADEDGKPVLDGTGEVLAQTNADGYPLIEKVFDDGPAGKAGMKAGDALKSVNGVDLKNKTLKEVVKELKGQPGTPVSLVVDTAGVERKLDIVRGVVSSPAVTTKRYGDVGYIQLSGFEQDDTVAQMRKALSGMADAKSLVIDLRGNPGGRVDICIDLASMFVEEGEVVSIRNRVPFGGHSKTTYKLTKDHMVIEERDEASGETSVKTYQREANLVAGKKIVILVNGHSASASEMFTGALKDNNRAVVVGEKTFGKGIGQMMLPMPNGTILRITTLRYFTPNGTWVGDGSAAHHGIEPNNVVVPGKAFRPGTSTDNQLEFALKLLRDSK
jgi:carboxyl-terminal processing protease